MYCSLISTEKLSPLSIVVLILIPNSRALNNSTPSIFSANVGLDL